jgi:predicted MFS family arabinose efflux permease
VRTREYGEVEAVQETSIGRSKRIASWPQGLILAGQAILPTMGPLLLVPAVPLLFDAFGTMPNATFWIPMLLTVPALCIALFAIPAGWLGDRIGRRRTLMIALLFYGIAGTAPLFLSGFAAIFASRVLLGLAEAVIITLSATMIGDYFQGVQRARWLAMISTIATFSAVLLLLIGGALGAEFGWRGPFAVYGISLLILPLMLLFTWEPSPAEHVVQIAEPPAIFPRRHLILSAAVTLFGSSLFYTLAVQQSLGLTDLGVRDPARIGLLSALASLANPVGTLVFRRFAAAATWRLLTAAFVILGVALLWMATARSDVIFAAAAGLGLFGAGILMPTLITWTMRELPFIYRGIGTGIFQSAFAFGQFASTLLMAVLVGKLTGSALAAFGIIGAGALIAAGATVVAAMSGRGAKG